MSNANAYDLGSLLAVKPTRATITTLQADTVLRLCNHSVGLDTKSRAPAQRKSVVDTEELALMILPLVDFAGLASASRASRQLRRLVRVCVKARVEEALAPFIPKDMQRAFFDQLRAARGLLFGDIPLQAVLDRRWVCPTLHISVPQEYRGAMRLWLAKVGFLDSSRKEAHFDGCKTYTMPHCSVRGLVSS